MDFDTAKENIQPLRGGRRPDRLETALGGEKDLLEHEKKDYENAINSYSGQDPLDNWYSYICWIEQSYPKSGNESGLHDTVSKCILKFETDTRYRQDRRLIKLFIKYIDTQDNPHELYEQLYNSGIGTIVSDLYIAWSYYYDAVNDFKKAESIFQKGFNAGAQPYDELAQAHQAFSVSVTQRMLYDDDSSKKQFQATLDEKRNALTTLRAYNKKFVGSSRIGSAVKSDNPGIVAVNENVEEIAGQRVNVLKDDGLLSQAAGTSGIKSIFDISKKTENVHEAGPWNKASKSNKNKLFDSNAIGSSHPGFDIMEDEALPPMPCSESAMQLFNQGCKLPPNWVSQNTLQTSWNIPTVIEEPTAPNSIPMYEKFMLYPAPDIEISPEELRGYQWFKLRDIQAPIITQYASIFENKFENGARIFPGFVASNIEQDEVKFPLDYELDNQSFQFPIKMMISADRTTEYSPEELLAEKYKQGKIKLVTNDDFEETDDMDMTIIGDRRESVYHPPRKSFVPRKSILRKSVIEVVVKHSENRVRFEEPIVEEPETEPEPIIEDDRKNLLKRKLEIDEEEKSSLKDRSTSPESKRLSGGSSDEFFKAPAPPKSKPVFEILDDESDETFSTKNFNLFIKSQSVSTPISKKTATRLNALATDEPESPTELTIQPNHPGKQLSTIVEVTETSNSTKSSVSQSSGDHEVTQKTQAKLSPVVAEAKKWEDSSQNPINMFRIPEDQTETTPFIKSILLPKLKDLQPWTCPMTPFKILEDFPTESFNIPFPDLTLVLPFPDETIPGALAAQTDQDKTLIPTLNANQSELPELSMKKLEIPPTQDISLDENDILEIPPVPDFTIQELDSPEQEIDKIAKNSTKEALKNLEKSEILTESIKLPVSEDTRVKQVSPDNFEIPQMQNLSIDEVEHVEIPETQEISLNEAEHFEIPATQELSINDSNIQSSQDNSTKEPEHVELPATQEIEADIPVVKMTFAVYEDSVCYNPETVAQPAIAKNQSNFSNMSRKENLAVSELNSVKKTNSDEFLELCANSPMASRKAGEQQRDVSDLLKFSDIKSKLSLEASFGEMKINKPVFRSPSPTMNILEADLNTEKFNMPLKFDKNSTIIGDVCTVPVTRQGEIDETLELSIMMDEEESRRLGVDKGSVVGVNQDEVVFKVPLMPAAKPVEQQPQSSAACEKDFVIYEDNNDDDLSKSIYYHDKKDVSIIEQQDKKAWEDEKMCSYIADDKNCYEYTIIHNFDESVSIKLREAIANSNGNPFGKKIRELILEQCNFEEYLEDHVETCTLLRNVPQLKTGKSLECGSNAYTVLKMLGKGSFGSVFEVRNLRNSESYAAKQEKPANMWEYFILIELQSRLTSKSLDHIVPAFMHIYSAIIANNASIFISEYSQFGTIIDVCNKIKKVTGKNVDEYIGMIFSSQLLSIIDYLHSCHIIHADIKPDNFLLMSKIEIGMKVPALQLIDFGSAIDMESFDKKDVFTFVVQTDNFTCCEMLENKPWTYQTDLFGICGTTHVMLFGKYMEVEKRLNNWQIKTKFPRYFQKYLWDIFFNTLLNVPDCKIMPNLQNLKQQFDEEIVSRQKYILDKVIEFNNALVS